MVGRRADLPQALLGPLGIVGMQLRYLQHADDGVHRRAYLVAHTREKLGFRLVGGLGGRHGVLHGQLQLLLGGHVAKHHQDALLVLVAQGAGRIRYPPHLACLQVHERELALLRGLHRAFAQAVQQRAALLRQLQLVGNTGVCDDLGHGEAQDAHGLRHDGRDGAVHGAVQVHRHVQAVGQGLVQVRLHGHVALEYALAIRGEHERDDGDEAQHHHGEHHLERGEHDGCLGAHVLHGYDVAHVPAAHRRHAHVAVLAVDVPDGKPRLARRHRLVQRGQVLRIFAERQGHHLGHAALVGRSLVVRCLVEERVDRHAAVHRRFRVLDGRHEYLTCGSLEQHEVVAAVEHVQLLVHGEQGQGNLHVQRAYLLPIEVEGTLRQAHTTAVVQLERGGIRVLALGEGRFRLGHLLHGERRAVREDPAAVLVRERDLREAEPVAQALQRRHDGSRVGRLHLERADGVLHDEDAVRNVGGSLLRERDHLLLGSLLELLVDVAHKPERGAQDDHRSQGGDDIESEPPAASRLVSSAHAPTFAVFSWCVHVYKGFSSWRYPEFARA